MRTFLNGVRNKFLIAYVLAYAVALWHMSRQPGFEPGEALGVLVIVGVIFSSLALLVTRNLEPLPTVVKAPVSETAVLLVWLTLIAAFLVWGMDALRRAFPDEPLRSVVIAVAKLVMVVLLPAAVLARGWGYRAGEFAAVGWRWRQLRPALWMSLAGLLMQAVLGRGLRDLSQAQVPGWTVALATPLAFLWLALEVGLVEEFFFRVLLQTRIARLTGSELSGIVAASALFGLIHAPGLYLRTATTGEALAASPSLASALAYSIVVTSVTGFFLGILWSRTRNIAVPVLVHAATDLIPNLLPFLKAWHPL